MAITKITRDALYTGIDDNSDATAITIDSSEQVGIGNTGNSNYKLAASGGVAIGSGAGSVAGGELFAMSDGTNFGKMTIGAGPLMQVGTRTGFPLAFFTSNAERMRIDTSGRVTAPNQPMFHANFLGTGQHSPNSGSNVHLVFDEAPVNIGSHYSTSTGRFTAPVTGNYYFSFTWQAHGGYNGTGFADIHKNGVGYYRYRAEKVGQNYATANVSGVIRCNANDYLQIYFANIQKLHRHYTNWSVVLLG